MTYMQKKLLKMDPVLRSETLIGNTIIVDLPLNYENPRHISLKTTKQLP
jgi:hypothetical protein